MKNNKIKHAMTAASRYMMSCTWALTLAMALASSTNAQDRIFRVDIANGSLTGDGQDWGEDSIRFLQDALAMADDYLISNPTHTVEIWVAAGTYLPNQSVAISPDETCFAGSEPCDECCQFRLRRNVSILGGFDGTEEFGFERDPSVNTTILSGDLAPAADVVTATDVDASATLDGFTIRGGIALRRSQLRIRDCTIELPEDAAVVCHDASHASFQRCTFALHHGESIIIRGTSRVELLLCEPAAELSDLQRCDQARVGESSQLLIVDQAMWDAAMARSAAGGEDQSGESATGTRPQR